MPAWPRKIRDAVDAETPERRHDPEQRGRTVCPVRTTREQAGQPCLGDVVELPFGLRVVERELGVVQEPREASSSFVAWALK